MHKIRSLVVALFGLAATLTPTLELRSQALVRDIRPPQFIGRNGDPADIVFLNGLALFSATDEYGRELWVSDGNPGGTRLLKDLNPGAASASPEDLVAIGNRVFFTAVVAGIGRELCVTDGTSAGTDVLLDLRPGTSSSFSSARFLVEFTGKLLFAANDGVGGAELWSSDGTAAGTQVAGERAGAIGLDPRDLTVVGTDLFFSANGGIGRRLWKSQGSLATTQQVSASVANPSGLYDFNGTALFRAGHLTSSDFELFRSDGTDTGTMLLAEVRPGNAASNPSQFVTVGTTCMFAADDGVHGAELWKTDGSTVGTSMVLDIRGGSAGSAILEPIRFGGKAYFRALSGSPLQDELWCSDGTAGGTNLAVDPSGPIASTAVRALAVMGNELFFTGAETTVGLELWKTDGTPGGTQLVRDIHSGGPGSAPSGTTSDGTHLWFAANDGVNGSELWQSDGTTAGTLLVKDLAPPTGDSNPGKFVDFSGELAFLATEWVVARRLDHRRHRAEHAIVLWGGVSWRARWTTPIPPPPIRSSSMNWPNRSPVSTDRTLCTNANRARSSSASTSSLRQCRSSSAMRSAAGSSKSSNRTVPIRSEWSGSGIRQTTMACEFGSDHAQFWRLRLRGWLRDVPLESRFLESSCHRDGTGRQRKRAQRSAIAWLGVEAPHGQRPVGGNYHAHPDRAGLLVDNGSEGVRRRSLAVRPRTQRRVGSQASSHRQHESPARVLGQLR